MPVAPGLAAKLAAASQTTMNRKPPSPPVAASPSNPFNGAQIAQLAQQNNTQAKMQAQQAANHANPNWAAEWKANDAATTLSTEVQRKAAAGIPLTNPTAASQAMYDKARAGLKPPPSPSAAPPPAPNKPQGVPGYQVPGSSTGQSVPQAAKPPGYTPGYKGPDMAGMSQQLKDIFSNRQASELQKLRDALATAQQGYNSQETLAKQSAYDNRNQADTINMQNAQGMRETMANAGLNKDGQNLSLQSAQNAQRLGDLGQINRQETNAIQDIGQKRSLLNNNEAQNELGLLQQINSDQAAAQFDLSKYGDTRAFDTEKYNYGRYRDDVNQQFAEDQFDYGKTQDQIQNDAQYGGTYGSHPTFAAQQQQIQNNAQYGGTYNGQKTADQQQQDWQNRFNYGSAIGQFNNGQQTVQSQQLAYNKVRDAIGDKQWQATFDKDVKQFGMNYAMDKLQNTNQKAYQDAQTALSQDQNDLDWIKQDAAGQGDSSSPQYSGMSAGQVLSSLKGQVFDDNGALKQGTTPDSIYRSVVGYGLPDGQDDQVMMALGLSKTDIDGLDKKYGVSAGN